MMLWQKKSQRSVDFSFQEDKIVEKGVIYRNSVFFCCGKGLNLHKKVVK